MKDDLPPLKEKDDELEKIRQKEEAFSQKVDPAQQPESPAEVVSDSRQAASGDGSGTSSVARNSRAVSLPGAFRIDHPDASAQEGQENVQRGTTRGDREGDDDDDAVFIVPRAIAVHESAAVTYASELVEAAPMPSPDDDDDSSHTPQPQTPRDSVLIKRRHAKLFVFAVILLVVGLLVSLMVAMASRTRGTSGSNESPLEPGGDVSSLPTSQSRRQPQPTNLRSHPPGPAPTAASSGAQPQWQPSKDCNDRRLGNQNRGNGGGGRCGGGGGQGKKNCNDRLLKNGGGGCGGNAGGN